MSVLLCLSLLLSINHMGLQLLKHTQVLACLHVFAHIVILAGALILMYLPVEILSVPQGLSHILSPVVLPYLTPQFPVHTHSFTHSLAHSFSVTIPPPPVHLPQISVMSTGHSTYPASYYTTCLHAEPFPSLCN